MKKGEAKTRPFKPMIFKVVIELQMPNISDTVYTAVFEHVSGHKRDSLISFQEIEDGVVKNLREAAVKRQRSYRTEVVKLISVEVKEIGLLSSSNQKKFLTNLEVPFRIPKNREIKDSEDFLVELHLELQSDDYVTEKRFEWIKSQIEEYVADKKSISPVTIKKLFGLI
jgi:tRNA threonylcarbamoyladenosine modification (KEOPS) complex  Pcc1 subunit